MRYVTHGQIGIFKVFAGVKLLVIGTAGSMIE